MVFLAISPVAWAQLMDNWWTVDGGGGTSSAAQFTLNGTIGQANAGVMSGGGYILRGGFWGIVATLPPRLTITYTASTVSICWPYPSSGYILQSASLINPTWTPVSTQPTQIDPLTWCVSLPTSSNVRFYRLKKIVS